MRPDGRAVTKPGPQRRLLVTGSRHMTQPGRVEAELARLRRLGWAGATLVHGDAPGVDKIAAAYWARHGDPVEAHPANWRVLGRAAGPERNRLMCKLGADLCVAFPIGPLARTGSGTGNCVLTAMDHGIPVSVVRWDGD